MIWGLMICCVHVQGGGGGAPDAGGANYGGDESAGGAGPKIEEVDWEIKH